MLIFNLLYTKRDIDFFFGPKLLITVWFPNVSAQISLSSITSCAFIFRPNIESLSWPADRNNCCYPSFSVYQSEWHNGNVYSLCKNGKHCMSEFLGKSVRSEDYALKMFVSFEGTCWKFLKFKSSISFLVLFQSCRPVS